jgi:hypothetical protein
MEQMTPAARQIIEGLHNRLSEVGEGIDIGVTSQYIKYKVAGQNFAELGRRTAGVAIAVHPDGYGLEPGASGVKNGLHVKRATPQANLTLSVTISVGTETDLNEVARALRSSYEAVKRRRTQP